MNERQGSEYSPAAQAALARAERIMSERREGLDTIPSDHLQTTLAFVAIADLQLRFDEEFTADERNAAISELQEDIGNPELPNSRAA